MNHPICVFYHCLLHSKHRQIDPDYALALITDQMDAMNKSGLTEAADAIYIGVNGNDADAAAISMLVPPKSQMLVHGPEATTEINTLNILHDWSKNHTEWNVLYHHTKGVSTPNQADGWRKRMELYCVWNWKRCVDDLNAGIQCCGCHWLTPEQHGSSIKSPFFGGNFWFAKASYLKTLPPLPPPTWENRYEAETWIGKNPQRPRTMDYFTGWPTPN